LVWPWEQNPSQPPSRVLAVLYSHSHSHQIRQIIVAGLCFHPLSLVGTQLTRSKISQGGYRYL
jgi:hypothetical protein